MSDVTTETKLNRAILAFCEKLNPMDILAVQGPNLGMMIGVEAHDDMYRGRSSLLSALRNVPECMRINDVIEAAIRWRDARGQVLLVSEQNLGAEANRDAGREWQEAVDALINALAALDASKGKVKP